MNDSKKLTHAHLLYMVKIDDGPVYTVGEDSISSNYSEKTNWAKKVGTQYLLVL